MYDVNEEDNQYSIYGSPKQFDLSPFHIVESMQWCCADTVASSANANVSLLDGQRQTSPSVSLPEYDIPQVFSIQKVKKSIQNKKNRKILEEMIEEAYFQCAKMRKFVGPLSIEERNKKIKRYLDKKSRRQLQKTTYLCRQKAAIAKPRYKGRFIRINSSTSESSSTPLLVTPVNSNATSNYEILLDCGNNVIPDTVVVNNATQNLMIRGLASDVSFLVPSTGLTGKPMFNIQSNYENISI